MQVAVEENETLPIPLSDDEEDEEEGGEQEEGQDQTQDEYQEGEEIGEEREVEEVPNVEAPEALMTPTLAGDIPGPAAPAPRANGVREVAGVDEEQVSLQDWLDPEVPGPHPEPVEEDATGWSRIDTWGVWDCTLCQFPTMADIPGGYRAVWASTVAKVLQAIREAEGGLALERALKWFLILPKALFRQGRRGGKAGKGLVGQRVNCLMREDWGRLLTLLERDTEVAVREDRGERREAARREERERWSEERERDGKRRNALSLLSRGLISKAVRTINSFGIGDMGDPEVRDQMEAKYPDRGAPLPPSVTRGQCIDSLHCLKDVLLGLEGGISAGTGGLRPEYLTCLAETWGKEDMAKLEEFGMRYLTGQLPTWWYRVWLTVATVPLYKTIARTAVRPIGIRPCLSRAIHKVVTKATRPAFTTYFEPQQVVLSQAGAAKLVMGIRMLAEANPQFVVVKSDIKNAFNAVSRARILGVMEGEEELRHLVWHAAQTLAPSSALEHGGRRWGEASEGATQGDPPSAAYFSLAWHPQLRVLDAQLARVGGAARAGMDDLYAVGPPEVLFPALERFWGEVEQVCQLTLERSKTEVFSWVVMQQELPMELTRAGTMVAEEFQPGFICYGIPVGSREYVRHHLHLKVLDVAREVGEVLEALEGEGQAIWTVARSSTLMKLDYHISLCYPSDMVEAAKEMDHLLWGMVERATNISIPKMEEGRGVECCLQLPITRHRDRTYQDWMLRTPVRMGGFGLRSMEDVSLPAFMGAVEQSLPHFLGEEGIFPQLAATLGEVGEGPTRWRGLMESGCRTGEELRNLWTTLQEEARQMTTYLGTELQGPLALPVEGAGEGSSDGSTRRRVTSWLEDTRAATLKKGLENHVDQTARPVWAHPQLDKLSQGWILSLPGPGGLSQAEFSETVARHLCLPSPCCAARVGEPLGMRNLTIDPFGDSILSVSNIPGGSFTARHDLVKGAINSLILDSGLRADCEVFGVFRDLIPSEALTEEEDLQTGRGRQGLLPDFRLDLPGPGAGAGPGALGNVVSTLAELKVIGAVKTYYPRGGARARTKKGVERRGGLIPGEYRRPLASLDTRYHGVEEGQTGPLVRRLEGHGRLLTWVMGSWQEGSKDLHGLLDILADSKVQVLGLARGREATERERAMILSGYRRILSTTAARASSGCLLGRLARVGEAHRAAAKRRAWAKMEGERLEEERRAHWRAHVQGRGVMRGEFVYPV
jgi:hypothetical protein